MLDDLLLQMPSTCCLMSVGLKTPARELRPEVSGADAMLTDEAKKSGYDVTACVVRTGPTIDCSVTDGGKAE